MKKNLLTLGLAVIAGGFSAYAANAYSSIPGEGKLDLVDQAPAGLASIEVNCTGTINRLCEGFATLIKDGVPIRSIPASNARMVNCISGMDKGEVGTPHITFFDSFNSPAREPGEYTVIIPYNFFTVAGEPNSQLEYHYTIEGSRSKITYEPEQNANIQELSTIKVTFEGATRLSYNPKSDQTSQTGIFYLVSDPNNDSSSTVVEPKEVTIDGNVATISFEPFKSTGIVDVNIMSGIFRYQTPTDGTQVIPETMIRYYFSAQAIDGFQIYPDPATVKDILPYYSQEEVVHNTWGDYTVYTNKYFQISAPEGYTPSAYGMPKPSLYIENPDGTLTKHNKTFSMQRDSETNDLYFYLSGEENKTLNLAPGKYYFVLPKNSINMQGPDGVKQLYSSELKFGPWIVEGEPMSYTVSPAADEELTSVSNLTFTFPEGTTASVGKSEWLTILSGIVEYDFRPTAEGNKVIIDIVPAINIPGEYTFSAPAAAIFVDGKSVAVNGSFTIFTQQATTSGIAVINNDKTIEGTLFEADPDLSDYSYYVLNVETGSDDTASMKFLLPEGYDAIYFLSYPMDLESASARRIPAQDLVDGGFVKLENNTLSGMQPGTYQCAFSYAKGEEAEEPTMLILNVKQSQSTGIDSVEVAEEADYYTLQGVKVANPEKGIYIKVANGAATKVVL